MMLLWDCLCSLSVVSKYISVVLEIWFIYFSTFGRILSILLFFLVSIWLFSSS
ncbi:unnamed protein product [Arabidopsis halleri]